MPTQTNISEIFKWFSHIPTDFAVKYMDEAATDETNRMLFERAVANFTCFKHKAIAVDENGGIVDEITQEPILLTREEIEIITALMIPYWVDKILLDRTLLQQHYGTKEVKLSSPAEHVKQLRALKASYAIEAQVKMSSYDYRGNKRGSING